MQSILLFSRCELVDLYGSMSPYLSSNYDVIHLAFSNVEADILRNKYNINNVIIFKDEVSLILDQLEIDNQCIDDLDSFIFEQTEGRFTLNGAIQSDRGFCLLSYSEALKLSQAYYFFWDTILNKKNIQVVLHEPPSLFFNHIGSLVCKRENIMYCSQIMSNSDKPFSYLFIEGDNYKAVELNSKYFLTNDYQVVEDKDRIIGFLNKFNSDDSVFLGNFIKSKTPYIRIFLAAIKSEFHKIWKTKKYDRIKDNIDFWSLNNENVPWTRFKNLLYYKFNLSYDEIDIEDEFYYYPIHLEPEAVVLYWGDGLYQGQIKLIQNIAAQIPPNTFLYVKDHPHYIGYRSYLDYVELQKVPNIKILSPEISGRSIIKKSKGVITINGTGGFEGLLMNKPVYIFGNAFYENVKNRVFKIKNIKDLNRVMMEKLDHKLELDMDLSKFVLAYLDSCHEGVTDYFAGRITKYPIDINKNTENIAADLTNLIDNYKLLQSVN